MRRLFLLGEAWPTPFFSPTSHSEKNDPSLAGEVVGYYFFLRKKINARNKRFRYFLLR